MSATETHQFKSEARELLDLMIHSLYSNKEIFLRELISNSSDAIDKLRFEALTHPDLLTEEHAYELRIETDEDARTLTLHDSGIGMSREEIIKNLGTIAGSGTREFAAQLKEAKTEAQTSNLIGQFGVGFYASFMVADKVDVISRRAGETTATHWSSTGDGTFSVEDAERSSVGTSITLTLKSIEEDDSLQDFSKEWTVRSTVKKYSDFVQHPIRLKQVRSEKPLDDEGNEVEDAEEVVTTTWDIVNSMKAIWTRPKSEVTDEEYNTFYKHIAHDWTDPLEVISFKAEGLFEYQALLFIPERPPHDLFYRNAKFGLQLYVNRILVMEQSQDLLPDYLRFVKGVIDSPDLSLNVSREILQKNRHVKQIQKRIVKKVLDALITLQREDSEKYASFWNNYGRLLKEGVTSGSGKELDKLKKLFWFESSTIEESKESPEGYTTLDAYIERMDEDQEAIYYITGESRQIVDRSPHLEAFKERNYEVLYLTDPVDEIMLGYFQEYEDYKLVSVGKGSVELGNEEEKKKAEEKLANDQKEHASLLEYIQGQLEEYVTEVRLSNRLTSSPVCLISGEGDMSPHLERLLQRSGGEGSMTQKRIMELNPSHPILARMQGLFDENATSSRLGSFAHLLHGQALLAEGSPLPDPVAFSNRVAELMV